jgi:hypothetical protein
MDWWINTYDLRFMFEKDPDVGDSNQLLAGEQQDVKYRYMYT